MNTFRHKFAYERLDGDCYFTVDAPGSFRRCSQARRVEAS